MANNEDARAEGSKSVENHSNGVSTRRSPSHQKKLNFNNEAFLLEEQTRMELEEAEKKAVELHEKLRFVRKSRQPADRGDNPDYTQVLIENHALRFQMQDLMKEVCSLSKCPVEGVCSPSDLTKIAQEVGCSMRGNPREPFISSYPFAEEVMRVEVPTKFHIPAITPCNGMSDPSSFVATYRQHMVIHGWTDALFCRAFPSLLSGPAQEWFKDLPNGTICCFEELAKKFC